MIAAKPIPFRDAVRLLQAKELMPTNLSSAQLEQIEASIRRQSMFSARVSNATFLQEVSDRIARMVEPAAGGGTPGSYMNATRFRVEMRDILDNLGYVTEAPAGSITNLRSAARLNLIADTNVAMAQGYGQHVQGHSEEGLDAFPAQELFRLGDREVPRDWDTRWADAGGVTYEGRYVALKGDRIWETISRFGNPYPPFDFNSGMWVKDVPRAEAERLGVVAPGERPAPRLDPMPVKTDAGRSFSPAIAERLRELMAEAVS